MDSFITQKLGVSQIFYLVIVLMIILMTLFFALR